MDSAAMQEKLESVIKDAIVVKRANSAGERERIYNAARSTLRKAGGSEEQTASLEAIIDNIESKFAPEPRTSGSRSILAWLAPAIALTVGVAGGVATTTYLGQNRTDLTSAEQMARRYESYAGQLPVAEAYLRQVLEAVLDRQSRDGQSLAASSKGFIALNKFDGALAKLMPSSLPPGTSVIVRADTRNVKVLMNWTLCGVAQIAAPKLVDPVRSKLDTLGCPNFGVWTDGAERW